MSERIIHLVFKTHLDIGFTDLATKVRAQYHQRFIPQAIETGEHFLAEDPEHPAFIWTTGAWLIWDYLNSQSKDQVKRLERAIERGLIRWHALPFTTHSELMSPALFRAGLSYSQELNRRFNRTTTGAKMTDVPGHTIGIVPLLAEAGVRFLHLGVNSASPTPGVPDIFRWRVPDGSEVVVMYETSYGATHFPNNFSEGLSFAHTNDNMGPQDVPQTVEAYRSLRHLYPDAEVRASTLDDYGALLWARREEFPVVDIELGDSWIYGSASDPDKTARFLALQRTYDAFAAEPLTEPRLAFGRGLTLVAEHTCGVDIKSYLRDETAWDRRAFEALRKGDARFAYAEASWAEQRTYLDAAMAELDQADRAVAEASLEELDEQGTEASLAGWQVDIDPMTGDVVTIVSPTRVTIVGEEGSLLGYRYESYDAVDVQAWMDTYLTDWPEWAILDHSKPGLDRATTARSRTYATRLVDGERVLDPEARRTLGAPASVDFVFRGLDDTRLEIAVILHNKPANRMPEASFVTFTPSGSGSWEFRKMGLWQRAERVAGHGGGQLQAVSAVRRGPIELRPLDTPLIGPIDAPFMRFDSDPPSFNRGLRFNLHNNKWGTNFPAWWEVVRFKARFVVTVSG